MKFRQLEPSKLMGGSIIAKPFQAATQTFLSLGAFDTELEAINAQKYIKTKFARALLGISKVTQHTAPKTWRYVPLQDFTANSDIDWSRSVSEIDRQLYAKYDLSADEIAFIESALVDFDEPPMPRAERELERSIAAKILGHEVALDKMRRSKFFRLLADLMRLAQFADVELQAQQFCINADANDLDWTVSVAEIDAQLYRKYGFSKPMIDFVEGRYSYDGTGLEPR